MRVFILMGFLILSSISFVQSEEPEQKFHGFNLQGYTSEGEKSWDVNGDTADILEGGKIKLTNVDANAYGSQPMNVKAQEGTIDQISGKMHLERDVVITNADGARLTTDSLDWDRDKDLITTQDDVMIRDEGFSITGKGLQAQPGLKNATIQKDVRVVVLPDRLGKKDEKQSKSKTVSAEKKDNPTVVTITCDGPMVIDQAKHMAEFNKNVVAIHGDQILRADRLELYIDPETEQIKRMICIGNVEIEQGLNKSYAERVVYDAQTQKMTMFGHPKIIMVTEGDNAITASGN